MVLVSERKQLTEDVSYVYEGARDIKLEQLLKDLNNED